MVYWFTSDFHMSHFNIIRYCNRPFDNVEEMNRTIIENHNERVSPEDTVFFLGDFRFGDTPTEDEFNGKFIFIKGNHDHSSSKKAVIQRMVLDHGGHKLLLLHNPAHITEDDTRYDFALTAHVHNTWQVNDDYPIPAINTGVDVWGFKPQQINDILGRWYREQNN